MIKSSAAIVVPTANNVTGYYDEVRLCFVYEVANVISAQRIKIIESPLACLLGFQASVRADLCRIDDLRVVSCRILISESSLSLPNFIRKSQPEGSPSFFYFIIHNSPRNTTD